MAKFILVSSLFGLISLQGVLATPKVYPEVIPGPGLPSLAELNTTTAELYEMGLPEGKKKSHGMSGIEKHRELPYGNLPESR